MLHKYGPTMSRDQAERVTLETREAFERAIRVLQARRQQSEADSRLTQESS
jgi:hypothetical protein